MTEARSGRGRRLRFWLGRYLAGLAAMSLTVMAFHPVAFRPLLFVGPALFLVLLGRSRDTSFRPIWWGGMSAWGGGMLGWIGSLAGAEAAGKIGWIIVSGIFLLMSWPFLHVLRRLLRRGLPLVLAAPLAMTAFDAFRRLSSQGLSWHDLGYALDGWNMLIQVADLASVYPVSFLVWAANGLVADLILDRLGHRPRGPREARLAPGAVALFMLVLLGYGYVRGGAIEESLRAGPLMAGLQTAIPQAEKMDRGESPTEHRHRIVLALMREAMAEGPVELVVWPETSFFPVDDSTRSDPRGAPFDAWLHQRRRAVGRSTAEEFEEILGPRFETTRVLLGTIHRDDMPEGGHDEAGQGVRERNSAFLLAGRRERGVPRLDRLARADKLKLVPFGEYIPFPALRFLREQLKDFVRSTAGYLPSMTPGEGVANWSLELESATIETTVNVCYEAVFPELFREGRRRGAEFAINVSNDSWYDDSAERDLVNAQIRFRAIENRFAILRVTNTGISVSMDPLGRESGRLERDRRAILVDRPALGAGSPPAVWLSLVVEWGLLLAAALATFLPQSRKS